MAGVDSSKTSHSHSHNNLSVLLSISRDTQEQDLMKSPDPLISKNVETTTPDARRGA